MQETNNNFDYYILSKLLDSLLEWNLGYLNAFDLIKDTSFCDNNWDVSTSKKRLYYLIWKWYIDFESIPNTQEEINSKIKLLNIKDEKNIKQLALKDIKTYYNNILFIKITSSWIDYQEQLTKSVESSKWIKWVFNKIKWYFSKILDYKYLIWFSLTWVCLILIFVFDIKVSSYIEKLPILSSVIDTDTLEQFEDINESDDFYQSILQELSSSNSWTTNWSWTSSMSKVFTDAKVKKVSPNENIFRVKLLDWTEQLITVKKDKNWKILVELPPKLKAIKDRIKNINLRNRQN